MKFPKQILPLIEDGLVDEVISQLMSGKEATVYVVRWTVSTSLTPRVRGPVSTGSKNPPVEN